MSNSSSSGGIGPVSALTLLFIALKLMGHIDWSWVWVLSPLWIWLCVMVLVLCVIGVVFVWGNKD